MPNSAKRNVIINRSKLDPMQSSALDRMAGSIIPDGKHWYDALCGAWGYEGGPTVAFIQAGLALPGPTPPDISGGGTGIFFNGRELHPQECAFLLAVFGAAVPGRYFLNNLGVLSNELGIPIVNLASAFSAAAGGGGAFSGAGAFGMVDGAGAVVNLPDGTSHVT